MKKRALLSSVVLLALIASREVLAGSAPPISQPLEPPFGDGPGPQPPPAKPPLPVLSPCALTGAPAGLRIVSAIPSSILSGTPLTVSVQVIDARGCPTGNGDTVTAQWSGNGTQGAWSSATVSANVATLSGSFTTTIPATYTLSLQVAGNAALSTSAEILVANPHTCSTAGQPKSAYVTSQPSTVVNGQPFSVTLALMDANGCLTPFGLYQSGYPADANVMASLSPTINPTHALTASASAVASGAISLPSGSPTVYVDSTGHATFDGLVISTTQAGPQSLSLLVSDPYGLYVSVDSSPIQVTNPANAITWPNTTSLALGAVSCSGPGVQLEFNGVRLEVYGNTFASPTTLVLLDSCIGLVNGSEIDYPGCSNIVVTSTGTDKYTAAFDGWTNAQTDSPPPPCGFTD